MKKYIGALIIAVAIMGTSVFAQTTSTSATTNTKDAMKNARDAAKTELKEIQAKRVEFEKEQKARKEIFVKELNQRKAEIKTKLQAEQKAFKEQLKGIKDAKKKQAMTNISDNIAKANTAITTNLINKIDKIDSVVTSLKVRAEEIKNKGQNVDVITQAISNAEQAISNARTTVKAQAVKIYTITIQDETTLKNDVAPVRAAFEADIKAARNTVDAAHIATREAALKVVEIARLIPTPSPTTGTSTPTTTQQ